LRSFKLIKHYRLPEYDYRSPGYYFVTICTHNRFNYFGTIKNHNTVELSPIGIVARQYWLDIPKHFPIVSLDEFIVMPNHVHGIIVINEGTVVGARRSLPERATCYDVPGGTCHGVPAGACHGTHLLEMHRSKFGNACEFHPPTRNSLSSIINHYKGAVKRYCNKSGFEYFQWQPRFHDNIIRSEELLYRIRRYIKHNPQKSYVNRSTRLGRI